MILRYRTTVLMTIGILVLKIDCNRTSITADNTSAIELELLKGNRTFYCNGSVDLFHCNESHCISEANKCDGIPDCSNGEDELVKYCGCLPNEYRCSNSCIDILNRCDRKFDCENGEDEQECEKHSCPVTHSKCSNHFCIPLESVCNFINDCGDNSDETGCNHRRCWKKEFPCLNGQCIRPGYLCDGFDDCTDGSDEMECSKDKFIRCGDGSLVHKYYACDGWPDCSDNHADELNCGDCDGIDEFLCSNSRCIRQANVCDGHCDCVGNYTDSLWSNFTCEDELDCDDYYSVENGTKVCNVGVTLNCGTLTDHQRRHERCIRLEFICDGINDCQNGGLLSDEYGCNATEETDGMFQCDDGRFLPSKLRCDRKPDCLFGEDEENCELEYLTCEGSMKPLCRSGECIDQHYICDRVYDCSDKSDEMDCHSMDCPNGWKRCSQGGQCIPGTQWCDFYRDCPDDSDEIFCDFPECTDDEFQCINGQCINQNERCLNTGKYRSGCSDDTHLIGCDTWKCPKGFYKCHHGPCINESLLCDHKIDCLGTWDDEDNCTFICAQNIPECHCRDVHIDCSNLSLTVFPENVEKEISWFHLSGNQYGLTITNTTFLRLPTLIFLDLSNNSIAELEPLMFRNLWKLAVLNLQNNKIKVLQNNTFYGLSSIKELHLQGNEIWLLQTMAFYGLSSLMTLDLHGQKISQIEKEAFVGLRNLARLDLSMNEITYLEDGIFIGMPQLVYLDLSKNRLHAVESSNVFRVTTKLDKLITDEFRFCCLARHVKTCLPERDEFSSCEDLMSNIVLRICIWVLGLVATFANLLVIVFRTIYKNTNKVHSFLIQNLAIGDLLMGTYLLLIAYEDWKYRGIYFIHDSEWRSSGWCSFAGFLSTFSSELSVFTLTVITLDRFLVILFPFRTHRLEINRTRFLMSSGWLLAALISIIPSPFLKISYFQNFYGRSGVCLPLHITPDKPNGWEYSVFVFLFLNFLSFTIIASSYLWMYFVARSTHRAVKREKRTSESAMAFRMTILVATDAACWIPIILLGIWSLAGFTVPPQVFAWVAVFVLPLNAALNPVLYTLSTAPFLNPSRKNIIRYSVSKDNRRSCYNNSLHYNNTNDCATAEELVSVTSRAPSIRWLKKVDTIVIEHGETMPLKRIKKVNHKCGD